MRTNYFRKKYILLDHFWTSNYFFIGTLTKILQYGCPHCILRVQGKSLSGNIFLGKTIYFFHFRISSKFFGISGKNNFSRVVISALLISTGNYRGKKYFFARLKFQIFFVLWLKRILTSWRKKNRQGWKGWGFWG